MRFGSQITGSRPNTSSDGLDSIGDRALEILAASGVEDLTRDCRDRALKLFDDSEVGKFARDIEIALEGVLAFLIGGQSKGIVAPVPMNVQQGVKAVTAPPVERVESTPERAPERDGSVFRDGYPTPVIVAARTRMRGTRGK